MEAIELAKINYTCKIFKYKKRREWITIGLINSIKLRDKIKKQLQKRLNPELKNSYKNFRNSLTKLIKKVKYDYYKNQITENQNNMNKINQILNNATEKKNEIILKLKCLCQQWLITIRWILNVY